jgi:hypothetical protein
MLKLDCVGWSVFVFTLLVWQRRPKAFLIRLCAKFFHSKTSLRGKDAPYPCCLISLLARNLSSTASALDIAWALDVSMQGVIYHEAVFGRPMPALTAEQTLKI